MTQSARKAIGSFGLLAYMVLFIAFAVMLGERILPAQPGAWHVVYFVIAGVIWVLPLKPLFGWMNKPD